MGKQWPVKPSQKCRAGSIPAYPESPSQVRVLSGTIRYLQYPNIIWFHRTTGLVHGPFKAEIRVRVSVELYSSKR